VTNNTFIFETSRNTKPKEKKVRGTWHIMSPRLKMWGGHVPRVSQQIAPMIARNKSINWNRVAGDRFSRKF